jgi:hypothetical protein
LGVCRRHGRFGDTEIRQARAASCVEQDVTRLQVPMDDSTLVCMLERLGNLQEYGNDFEEARAAQATKIATGRELHRQNHCVARAFWRKHLEDGRMIEPACNCVLVLESTPCLGLMCGGIQYFEGDVDPPYTIVRAPHFALPARAQLIQQRVARIQLSTLDRCNGLSHISLLRSMRRIQRNRLDLRQGCTDRRGIRRRRRAHRAILFQIHLVQQLAPFAVLLLGSSGQFQRPSFHIDNLRGHFVLK